MVTFLGIHFAASHRFLLAPLFLLCIYLLIKHFKGTTRFIRALVHAKHKKNILLNFSHTKHVLKLICSSVALVFLLLAIMQPQWHKKDSVVKQEGRDLLIALDISGSMLAQDVKPNRLACTKLKIKALLRKLKFERVGLILFSGSAFVSCPLTADHETFCTFLDHVDAQTISSSTTAIDQALMQAIKTYKQYPDLKTKLVLLVTDGEDFSLDLKTVQQEASQHNIKIFALGVGTPEGAPVPRIDINGKQNGHHTDEKGNIAISKLHEPFLQDICKTLNGEYVKATYTDHDISHIATMIHTFEKEQYNDKKLSLYEDQYPWFLAISWICLALEWIL